MDACFILDLYPKKMDSKKKKVIFFPSMHQDNCGYLCMIIQPAMKEDAGWYTVSAKNEAGIVSSTARLDVHSEF